MLRLDLALPHHEDGKISREVTEGHEDEQARNDAEDDFEDRIFLCGASMLDHRFERLREP